MLMDVSFLQHPSDQTHSTRMSIPFVPLIKSAKVLELLKPGSFVTVENHPNDLPPFEVIHCRGGRCWVRQQTWGKYVHWEVEHRLLKSA